VKFVQTVRFSTTRIDEIKALFDQYEQDDAAQSPGLIGAEILKDRDRENAYMVVAQFESYEQAMENSARPETDAFAKKMSALVDGQVAYGNFDVIDESAGPAGTGG
jgi:quinol monooxygenase YgiN